MDVPPPKRVMTTARFRQWQKSLKDERTKAVIASRIKRLQFGNSGDVAPVGKGVSELRIDFGPGFRVYFAETDSGNLILLLAGGDKYTQQDDIKRAKAIFADLKSERRTRTD